MFKKYFKFLLFVLWSATWVVSCNSQTPGVKTLSPADFEKGITGANVQLVDVRTPEEYNEKHIANAVNIDVEGNSFEKQMQGLDKSKPLYVYCLSGGRSIKAAKWAASNGFTQVYNLEKGVMGWTAANLPLTSQAGAAQNPGMSFDEYLGKIKEGGLLLVDFSAVWCGPCKALHPIVEKVAKKNEGKLVLLNVDVDKNPMVAKGMNIDGIPLLILYKDGKEVWRSLGLIDEKELNGKVNGFLK
ncbi:MAG TPA: thioredoxin domain-containing protein [Chitinophagales bacterium]|nr:thioredoxin domain-containing protein [Chitinophagales bacterium]